MKPFSEILLISDMDDTLLNKDKRISKQNIEAIRRFQEYGGKFSIATGRSISGYIQYKDIIQADVPVILYNGAVLYDDKKEKVIWKSSFPEMGKQYVKETMEIFDDLCVGVMTTQGIRMVNISPEIEEFMERESIPYTAANLKELNCEWIKAEYVFDLVDSRRFREYIESRNHTDVRYVYTGEHFCEMLPNNVSKGNAIKELVKLLGYEDKKIYAIGDYNNDIEMLRQANIGFAVGNALDEVKEIADVVIASCEEHAIADAVSYIMNIS